MSATDDAKVLVTGGTGTVGAALLEDLVREPWVGHATATTRAMHRVPPSLQNLENLRWREVDLLADLRPGDLAAEGFTHVVHCAADVRWTLDEESARVANVRTTQRLIEALGTRPHRFVHVSTAYVQKDAPSADYRNTYERTKAEAEALVRERAEDAVIVRPSLVVGNRRTGEVTRPKGLYALMRLFRRGRLPFVVGDREARVDIVSSDVVSRWILHALRSTPGSHDVLNVAEGEGASLVGDLFETIVAQLRRTVADLTADAPTIVSPDRWDRFLRPMMTQSATRLERADLAVVEAFRPYLTRRSALAAGGCEHFEAAPTFASYLDVIVRAACPSSTEVPSVAVA